MQVPFMNIRAQNASIGDELNTAVQEVIETGAFAAGPFVKKFEEQFAQSHNARYCVGVNSGTAALHLALWALNIGAGDEVIVPGNTFIATAEAVSLTGATPVFVDCEKEYFNLDPELIQGAITKKTKAIIPVHLYGQAAKMDTIVRIAVENNLLLVEDCAQAHTATCNKQYVGTFGNAGCFSFYPGKSLGAFGEAGAIITHDESLYEKMQALKDHGSSKKYYHDYIGHNYRMEGLQGAVLTVKLKHIDAWTQTRIANAALYKERLNKCPGISLPEVMENVKHVWHLFVVRSQKRDALAEFLKDRGVFTGIHYPIPCHLQKAYSPLGYKKGSLKNSETIANEILSLPMSETLTPEEIQYVSECIQEFHNF